MNNPITHISVFPKTEQSTMPAVIVHRPNRGKWPKHYSVTDSSLNRLVAVVKRQGLVIDPTEWGWQATQTAPYRYSQLQIIEAGRRLVNYLDATDFEPAYIDTVDTTIKELISVLSGDWRPEDDLNETPEESYERMFGWPVKGQIINDDDLGNKIRWVQ